MLIAIYVVIAAFLCLMAIGDWKKWWWVCVIAMIAAGFLAALFPAPSSQEIGAQLRTCRANHVSGQISLRGRHVDQIENGILRIEARITQLENSQNDERAVEN